MIPVRNLNKKLVCAISEDGLHIEIKRGDCLTKITLSTAGKFTIEHERISA